MLNEPKKGDVIVLDSKTNYNFSKSMYMKIYESLPCAAILLDENDKIIELNSKALNIFHDLDLEYHLQRIMEKVNQNLLNSDENDVEKKCEYEIITGDCTKYLEVTVNCIKDDEMAKNIIFIQDVTNYKSSINKLKDEKKVIESNSINEGIFLANISHEIRTSINGIIGMTDLTIMTDLTLEQKENLKLVKSSALKLLDIVNSILDFSKINSGKMKVESIEFNFKELYNEIVRISTMKALDNKLEFKSKIDDAIPEILIGDPIKLKQILDNLIDNAIKFTKYGTVSLIIEKGETIDKKMNLKFYVKDTGIGIDKKDITKLFTNFSQIENKTYTKKPTGTGLGLCICKGLVELMNGKIEVKSRKDIGTLFSFNLFLQKCGKSTIVNIDDRKDKIKRINKKLNILIVEDDKASQIVMYNLFKKYGHICDIVNNGQEALNVLKTKQYDLILMDIQMPIMDGIQATKFIRKSEEGNDKHIPIIALTAYALKGDKEHFLGLGMDEYISKPFNVEELLQTVYKIVKKDEIDLNIVNRQNNIDREALFLYLL
ncbi:response regulator [Clostridium scatologenes]|uniref:Circadian input-output histidine kinase CikA n=1 Tax=Clostridium scatologenes TaxID=1548 RepID=A0A0E3K3J3_CLOSL|nr:response regulator [Clostridium scatologenes]AKA71280.1 histidine kinase [Clostridium scatologenes]